MNRWLLPLANFLSAAASLSVELAIVRLGAPYVGQSLVPWSAAIASVLLGLAVGHAMGGIAAGGSEDRGQLRFRLGGVWLAASLAAAIMPGAVEAVAQAFAGEQGFSEGAALAIALLAFPPSLAAGFVAPMTVRLAVLTPGLALPRTVGAIYAASAAGSVIGTALAGFVLLETIGAAGLVHCVSALWIALGVCVIPWGGLARSLSVAAAFAAIGTGLMAMLLATSGPCLRESRYTCIRLLDRPLPDGGLLRFMMLDEGVHSASDRDRPEHLHLGYAALADRLAREAMAKSSAPRALVIGGGGATLPRAWAAAGTRVTSIELDPVVASVADDQMWAGAQRQLTTVIGDGRAVVRSLPAAEAFDVILMDAYRTRSVPPHLVTREFNALIDAHLSPDGVFLSNIIDRRDTPSLAVSVATTLARVFPAVDLWMAGGEQGAVTNFVVAAWKNPRRAARPPDENVTVSVMKAGEAVQSRAVTWRRVDVALASFLLPQACAIVLTDDWAPVDRLIAGRKVCR